jgi:hypothetical protein
MGEECCFGYRARTKAAVKQFQRSLVGQLSNSNLLDKLLERDDYDWPTMLPPANIKISSGMA